MELISFSQATEPVRGYTTESVKLGQCDVSQWPVPLYTAWWTEAHCVSTTCPESLREAEWLELEPVTYWLQVRCPNHNATLIVMITSRRSICMMTELFSVLRDSSAVCFSIRLSVNARSLFSSSSWLDAFIDLATSCQPITLHINN